MDTLSELTSREKWHIEAMSAITRKVNDLPLVLKGGTALLLAYGLDRFSEDLDFDSHRLLRLENKIKDAVKYPFKLCSLDTLKDTATVTRYRLIYDTPDFQHNRLKIEISHRGHEITDYEIINEIKVYRLPTMISQKISALENRTAARDLYDINFLATKYLNEFTSENLQKLSGLLSDINSLEKRFSPAFEIDEILSSKDITHILLNLQEAISNLPK